MKTIQQMLPVSDLLYPLEQTVPYEQVLFLDIETTGFTAKSSSLYLIGSVYYQGGSWNLIQWFAEKPDEEKDVLVAFFAFASRFTHLIHFNGNNFDLPYLEQKCRLLDLHYHFDKFEGIDLYRRIAPYKDFLRLENCKQKTIEKFLNFERTDAFSAKELIRVYLEYVQIPTEAAFLSLTLHNAQDMLGMLEILPILAYSDLFTQAVRVKKAGTSYYKDYNGNKKQELLMKLKLKTSLKVPISLAVNGCYFSGEGDLANLKIPVFDEEMKFYYSNYKDYYYLPAEDTAIHKSVAAYVDRSYRIPATAATCYTKKHSSYLPQWSVLIEPCFKRDYKSRDLFFELTEERKLDRNLFGQYAAHILQMMLSNVLLKE